jgi:hypothetical protein
LNSERARYCVNHFSQVGIFAYKLSLNWHVPILEAF